MLDSSTAKDASSGLLRSEADETSPDFGVLPRGQVERVIAYGITSYAVLVWLATTLAPLDSAIGAFLTDWMAMPVEAFALVSCAWAVHKAPRPATRVRVCFMFCCAASVVGMAALIYWNLSQPHQDQPWLAAGDVLYLIAYASMAAALASLLTSPRATLRSPLIWLDGLSILAAVLASVWAIIYGPLSPPQTRYSLPLGYMAAYGVAAALLLTFASLVWLRKLVGEERQWTVALVAAGAVQATWIIGWMGSWLANSDFLTYLADYGEVLCYSLIGFAALGTSAPEPEDIAVPDVRRRMFVFLPTLALLVSIALISGLLGTHAATGAWVVALLTILCVLLLATRHGVAVAEFERLRDKLAQRESDERISELVRQSSDAFMIVTDDGSIGYVSPAIDALLGTAAAPLVGTEAAAAFGSTQARAVGALLETVHAHPRRSASIELTIPSPVGELRIARLVATNRLENARIRGIALVVTDISKERALEREVIEVANAERFRLAGDVHDGIGQELTGIALLLQRFVNREETEVRAQRSELAEVIGHLNRTIHAVRNLARGLSPLYEVHGSLGHALRTLASDVPGPAVDVEVDPKFDDRQIHTSTGEQLFRIAAEAVQNARRHAECAHVRVSLASQSGVLVLSVVDDGQGYQRDAVDHADRGAGLRIMEYRARVVGAALQIDSKPSSGTRVMATLRLPDKGRASIG